MTNYIIKRKIKGKLNTEGAQFSKEFLEELDKLVEGIISACVVQVKLEKRVRVSGDDVKVFSDVLGVKKENKEPVMTKTEEVKETIAVVNETNNAAQV